MREELLRLIENNSRIDTKELSKMLNVSEVDILNELSKLESENIICGYFTLIDWEKTSVEKVTALIEVRVTPQRGQGFDRIAERIYNYRYIPSFYRYFIRYNNLVIYIASIHINY